MLRAPSTLRAPANSIVIIYGQCLDDADHSYWGNRVFSVVMMEDDRPDLVLWRGPSYDEAIRQAAQSLAEHLPFRPALARHGVIDLVGVSH